MSKIILGQKILCQSRNFGSKIFGQIILVKQKFLFKKFWVKKNVFSKTIFGQINFWSKKIFGQKKFLVKKNFWSKIFLVKKSFKSIIIRALTNHIWLIFWKIWPKSDYFLGQYLTKIWLLFGPISDPNTKSRPKSRLFASNVDTHKPFAWKINT